MFKLKIVCIFFFLTGLLSGQTNLIPNPSFEIYDTCPNTTYQLSYAKKWIRIQESPDLFATCAYSTQVAVPNTAIGYQCPSTGNNFAGYVSFLQYPPPQTGAYQEIMGIKLTDSLIIGTKYFASLKLSLAGWNGNTHACSHNGLKLTTKLLPPNQLGTATPTNAVINNFAHIYSTLVISDTINWTTIKGSLVADSNYKYIYFGIFFQMSNVTMAYQTGLGGNPYYYIDDVCLSTDSNTCKIVPQNNCIPTSLKKITGQSSIVLSPNPTSEFVRLTGIVDPIEFQLISSTGQIVFKGIATENTNIPFGDLPSGLYYFRTINGRQNFTKTIIKQQL